MKTLLIIIAALIASGCVKEATPVQVTGVIPGQNFKVEFLFKKDRCSVYRFEDVGRSHYFTDCTEATGTYSESCGKNCRRQVSESIGGGK